MGATKRQRHRYALCGREKGGGWWRGRVACSVALPPTAAAPPTAPVLPRFPSFGNNTADAAGACVRV